MGESSKTLVFMQALADAADDVSRGEFRSFELRGTHKVDGTPVSQIDFDVEQAMFDIVCAAFPDDAAIGEEIGAHPGTSGRRWIFDGIDGTHNYGDGRPGWGTIIALEVDGEIEAGIVSAPVYGRRFWAERGGGAWATHYGDDGRPVLAAADRLRCGGAAKLAEASVNVIPWVGFLTGWRDQAALHFPQPEHVRSQCLALDSARVASGEIDVAILILGGIWDFAATSLMVREAGGVFRDAWGGDRYDTNTGVFTNTALIEPVLTELATLRPAEPDKPQLARTHSIPIGTPEQQAVDGWMAFGIRPLPSMSARCHVDNAPAPVLEVIDERLEHFQRPLLGVTTDGVLRPDLRLADAPKVETRPILDAALRFLAALTSEQRQRARFAIDAPEWRTWINVHMNHFRHGVMLEDLAPPVRELGLDIVRATLSARGFDQARTIMRINQLLAELTGDYEAFGEWPYFVSIFGEPGGDAPWGWQIDGHHLCINTMVFDGRIVMTPTFMGAEPRRINAGPYAGISLFDPEEAIGLDLIRALDSRQRDRAIIYPSIDPDEIPIHLQNMFDGRMQAGAFHDNLVAEYQGVPGSDMTDGQRRTLLSLAATYAGWSGPGHAEITVAEVAAHLDETWFSWYGDTSDTSPFYYRVHSPVILIEFDHHPGVAFDNEMPTRHHIHTLVRTPNGGDYGADLIRRHHEQFDHRHGTHNPR